MIQAAGSFVNGHSAHSRVDVVAAFNDVNDPDLASTVGWAPTLRAEFHPRRASGAYPGQIGSLPLVNRAGPSRSAGSRRPGLSQVIGLRTRASSYSSAGLLQSQPGGPRTSLRASSRQAQ